MTLITATTGTSPGAYCSRPEQVALCIEAPALNRFINDKATWTLPATAIPARSDIDMSQRLIAEEPMYMVLNLGISPGFQRQDYEHMEVRRAFAPDSEGVLTFFFSSLPTCTSTTCACTSGTTRRMSTLAAARQGIRRKTILLSESSSSLMVLCVKVLCAY